METITNETKAAPARRILYTGKTKTIGGRDGGSSISSDGRLDIKLATPGKVQEGTNPEQLFAAGWSACFIGAMKIAASKLKVQFPDKASVDAEVDLVLTRDQYTLQARLYVNLPGMDHDTAQSLVDAAHDT